MTGSVAIEATAAVAEGTVVGGAAAAAAGAVLQAGNTVVGEATAIEAAGCR